MLLPDLTVFVIQLVPPSPGDALSQSLGYDVTPEVMSPYVIVAVSCHLS